MMMGYVMIPGAEAWPLWGKVAYAAGLAVAMVGLTVYMVKTAPPAPTEEELRARVRAEIEAERREYYRRELSL